ncbi:MAG: hypothetical protein R3E79_41955 [Caldilineaceae bacterium]
MHRVHCIISSLSGDPNWYDEEVTQLTMDKPEMVDAWQWYIDLRTVDRVRRRRNKPRGFPTLPVVFSRLVSASMPWKLPGLG